MRDNTKRLTEIIEYALHCEETTYAVEAITELITASYTEGYNFAKNERGKHDLDRSIKTN